MSSASAVSVSTAASPAAAVVGAKSYAKPVPFSATVNDLRLEDNSFGVYF